MKLKADTPAEYLAAVPAERRPHIEKLRSLIKKRVPKSREALNWGALSYTVGERPFAAIASQKNYLSLYLLDLCSHPELREPHEAILSKLKMGKGCIRFQSIEELPLETIGAILQAAPKIAAMKPARATKKKK